MEFKHDTLQELCNILSKLSKRLSKIEIYPSVSGWSARIYKAELELSIECFSERAMDSNTQQYYEQVGIYVGLTNHNYGAIPHSEFYYGSDAMKRMFDWVKGCAEARSFFREDKL